MSAKTQIFSMNCCAGEFSFVNPKNCTSNSKCNRLIVCELMRDDTVSVAVMAVHHLLKQHWPEAIKKFFIPSPPSSKSRLCVKSHFKKRWRKSEGKISSRIVTRWDWHPDKEDTVIQWRHDNPAMRFMARNNQKSFYQRHIKERLVYASA